MYEFPYSATFEEAPAALPCGSRLISNAIELFGASAHSRFQPSEQLQLLSDFRRLWLLIADDFGRASGELAGMAQAGFPAAVQSVLQEIEHRRFKTSARSAARAQIQPEPQI